MAKEERYFTLTEQELSDAVSTYLGTGLINVKNVKVDCLLNGVSKELVLFTDIRFKEI